MSEPNTKIDDLLEEVELGGGEFNITKLAKEVLYKIILEEVIGEDKALTGFSSDGRVTVDMTQSYWNAIKAYQRTYLKELFNKQGGN